MKSTQWWVALPLVISIIILSYWTDRTDSVQLIGLFLLAFGSYAYLTIQGLRKAHNFTENYNIYIAIGIGLRLLLVFVLPNLSDDFYRFIWDGRLLNHGINPFLELPSYYIENNLHGNFLTDEIYQNLNSQNYFTIYPPVLQGIFMIATAIFPKSILGSVIVMKSFLLLFEIGSIFLIIKLLRHFNMPKENVMLYVLNPVVMLELVGSIHFEGAMIFFSLLAIWLLVKRKWWWSAISMGIAVVTKLLPLMFLPFLIRRLQWKSIRYYIVVGVTVLLLFSPLLNKTFIENIGESIGLYFQNFEYNGSVYYLLRWIGFQIEGYNMISYFSPWLSLTVAVVVFGAALRVREKGFQSLPSNMLFALTVFYLLSTTVHPWYITSMVAFSALTRFRYATLWSGLIFLTYLNYGYDPFRENLWIVALEYTVLFGWLIYEVTFFKKNTLIKK